MTKPMGTPVVKVGSPLKLAQSSNAPIKRYFEFPELEYAQSGLVVLYNKLTQWIVTQTVFQILKYYICDATVAATHQYRSRESAIQGLWLFSHVVTVAETLLLAYWFLQQGNSNIHYHICTVGIITTYSMVTAKLALQNPSISVVRSENGLLLATALITYYSNPNVLKLIPFALYSIFNIYEVVMKNIKADFSGKGYLPRSAVLEEVLLYMASSIELMLVPIYLYETTTTRRNFIIPYLFILLLRVESSIFLERTATAFTCIFCHLLSLIVPQHSLKYVESLRENSPRSPTLHEVKLDRVRRRNDRVASLNFDIIQIVNDI